MDVLDAIHCSVGSLKPATEQARKKTLSEIVYHDNYGNRERA